MMPYLGKGDEVRGGTKAITPPSGQFGLEQMLHVHHLILNTVSLETTGNHSQGSKLVL